MVKLKATELAKRAALEGIQMMGGMGYAVEGGMEEQFRTAVVGTIAGGSSEVQRDIIAKTLGLWSQPTTQSGGRFSRNACMPPAPRPCRTAVPTAGEVPASS